MRYVPVEIVRMLLRHKAEAVIGVEANTVTLFFSDIAGFTTISEQSSPTDLMSYLELYFEAMTDIILDQSGTLIDYIGDAIFACWNSPQKVEHHEYKACASALLQQKVILELNRKYISLGLPECNVRMGIHTGKVLIGNLGSSRRLKYTAVGDAVNLASRLENLNKLYGTKIIISEEVFASVRNHFLCRKLDLVIVKGKHNPTLIFELVASMNEATELQRSIVDLYHTAMDYYFSRNFEDCCKELDKLLAWIPEDLSVAKLRRKCIALMEQPPPENWMGVEILYEK